MVHAGGMSRRTLLASTAAGTVLAACSRSFADVLHGVPLWNPRADAPPQPVRPGPWQFFTPEEAAAVEALVDRLIPPDPQWPGGKDAGCAVFIDRQLAGPYGRLARPLHAAAVPGRRSTTGAAIAADPGDALSALARRARQVLPRHLRRQAISRTDHRPAGQDHRRARAWAGDAGGRLRPRLLRPAAAEHPGGILRRSDLWRQPRHEGVGR